MSRPRVTIFDYGAGNLHSLSKALDAAGADAVVEADPRRAVTGTDALVLPGVGAFGLAAARLTSGCGAIREALEGGLPCLGICLGMQLLFERSEEGPGPGIGLIPGEVTRLRAAQVPHIGWNSLEEPRDPLLSGVPLRVAYYANGFACRPDDETGVGAWSTHEDDRFPALVRAGRTVGVQFHPEKSSRAGLDLIRAFLDEVRT